MSAPHRLRLVTYRPGEPEPPRPALRKKVDLAAARQRVRERDLRVAAWCQGFCIGILASFAILIGVTLLHCWSPFGRCF